MRNNLLIIIVFFFITSNVNSQTIKGLIIDKLTGESIPYVEILSERFGCITDEKGRFSLNNNLITGCDTIYIKCLGYEDISYPTDLLKLNSNDTIKLVRKEFQINEAIVYGKTSKKIVKRGFYRKSAIGSLFTSGIIGRQVAVYIENPKGDVGKIKKLYYYITKQGRPTDKFRVHIYSALDKDSPPEEELLQESIYANANGGDEWVIVDVENYDIDFPPKGFFISLEFLEDTIAIIDYKNTKISVSGDKLNLGMNLEKTNQGYTWQYDFATKTWKQNLPSSKNQYYGNAMIATEIKIY